MEKLVKLYILSYSIYLLIPRVGGDMVDKSRGSLPL